MTYPKSDSIGNIHLSGAGWSLSNIEFEMRNFIKDTQLYEFKSEKTSGILIVDNQHYNFIFPIIMVYMILL